MVASIASTAVQVEPRNTFLKIGNTQVGLLSDSGSVCSILNESLATEVIHNSLSRWLKTTPSLMTFANQPIPVIGLMQTPVESKGWRIEDPECVVIRDGLKPLIAGHFSEALGVSITQKLCSDEGSMVNTITTQGSFKTRIANQFPQIISRTGRPNVHIIKSKFHKFF